MKDPEILETDNPRDLLTLKIKRSGIEISLNMFFHSYLVFFYSKRCKIFMAFTVCVSTYPYR